MIGTPGSDYGSATGGGDLMSPEMGAEDGPQQHSPDNELMEESAAALQERNTNTEKRPSPILGSVRHAPRF